MQKTVKLGNVPDTDCVGTTMTAQTELPFITQAEYELEWARQESLSQEDLDQILYDDVFFSLDLEEATYRIPHDVLDENINFLDEVYEGVPEWEVFRDLYATHERSIDMTELVRKKLWFGPELVKSCNGSFMGDGMSFLHLTLMLSAITSFAFRKAKQGRPIGQSVGDDLVLLDLKRKSAIEFCRVAKNLNCSFSKINSISTDSLTFCENYCSKVTDLDDLKDVKSFEDSIFGNLLFLDTIKGSPLSGKSKVKADGASPFMGHASLLNKQVKWHPLSSVSNRAKVFLWSRNYYSSVRLSNSMAGLPVSLGGADLALGRTMSYMDPEFQANYLPWYEALVQLPQKEFFSYYLLLRGIFQSNPKGYPWENDYEVIRQITSKCTVIDLQNINDVLPDWMYTKTTREKLSYIEKELKLISFHHIASLLARQESFLKMWNLEEVKSFVTSPVKGARERSNKVWGTIKGNVKPTSPREFKSNSMSTLENLYISKTKGFYVSKEDPAILDAFKGMPDLFFRIGSKS